MFLKISSFCSIDCTAVLQPHEIPSLQSIYTLDAAVSKVQVSLDEHFSKMAAETDPHKSSEITKNLLPATLQLIDTYASFSRCGDQHSLKGPWVCVYPVLVCELCVFPLVQDVKG